ncbi:MAG: hypothetical protein ACJ72H_21040 [Candidatus Sulfotelmatobacter sp.]
MSGFLIDTNVISELIKATPATKVAAWVDATDEQLFHLSVLTLGEGSKRHRALAPEQASYACGGLAEW